MARLEIAGRYVEIKGTRRVGGQSEVFQATDLDQGGRQVAVKIVPAKSDEIFRIYFERETAALRTLSAAPTSRRCSTAVSMRPRVSITLCSTGFRKLSRRGWRVFWSLRVGMMLPMLSLFRWRRRCRIPIRCRCCVVM